MNLERLKEILKERGELDYRFWQIYQAVFRDLCFDFAKIINIPQKLREELKKEIKIFSLKLRELKKGKESEKALFELEDGLLVETVLMRHKYGRKTVCISCAVGCPLKCKFCATGKMGFKRNLSRQEIVDQVLFFAKKEKQKKLNVVFMGMGEPFLNYDNVLEAIRVLNNKEGFNLAKRAISISTAGIIPAIKKLQKEGLEINLAISLNGSDDKTRSYLMPINKKYPLKELIAASKDYLKTRKRKLFFEYVMLKGVNDDLASARKLAKILRGEPLFHLNLIKYNETGTGFKGSDKETILNFQKELEKNEIKTTIRHGFGGEIEAACGQLITQAKKCFRSK